MTIPLTTIRRTATEILAATICKLFPEAQLIDGDVNELGFYYDFSIPQPLEEQMIPLIEEGMRTLIKENQPIRILDMMRNNAVEFFKHHQQPIKAELVSELPENIIPIFQLGEFHDYIPGKHVANSKETGSIKILEILSLDSDDTPIYRIQGTAFHDQKDLKKFLKRKETLKKRDHLTLGQEMDLFGSYPEISDLGWFWHPKGKFLKEILLDLLRKENQIQGFQPVATPIVCKDSFLKKGYRKHIFPSFLLDEEEYVLSASPNLAHASIFSSRNRTYGELPVRYSEFVEVYRDYSEGQLCGMLRTRVFTSDYGQIICRPEQVQLELISSLQLIEKIGKILGFEYYWYFIPKGQKTKGSQKKWEFMLDCMVKALEACGLSYISDEESESLSGPRIEMRLMDGLGREWSGPSVTADVNIPEQFGLHYQGSDGKMHVPVMITRSVFGSLERIVAILIERYAGQFPLWMAPEQVRVMTIGVQSKQYAESVFREIQSSGYRVTFDQSEAALGSKVHSVEREKVPYAVIIGNKEEKEKLVAIRPCGSDGKTEQMTIESFLQRLHNESKTLDLLNRVK